MFNLTRGEELTALIAVTLLGAATAAVCLIRGDKAKTVEIPLNGPDEVTVQKEEGGAQKKILVHVSGEVQKKGVFELKPGSRLKDLIEVAGLTENADREALNLAAPLLDGERVVVATKGATAPGRRPGGLATSQGMINVNTASQKELESLPGIGPVLARRIIEFREKRKFDSVDDLVLVRGIGPATLEKIREHVCVK